MAPHEFFSHTTAAILWGLPARVSLDDPLHVSVLHPGRAPRSQGVKGHQVQPALARVVVSVGVRLTSPATTWAMMGATCAARDLVVLGDALVRIPRGRYGIRRDATAARASLTGLAAAASAGRRLGAARLRDALYLIRVGSSSPPETHLRLELIESGLPEPALDVDVFGANGLYIGYTELAYPTWRVLVEYEGDHHRLDRTQWNRDIDKHARCAAAGWTVVRITADHLYHQSGGATRRVRAALVAAGWSPGGL